MAEDKRSSINVILQFDVEHGLPLKDVQAVLLDRVRAAIENAELDGPMSATCKAVELQDSPLEHDKREISVTLKDHGDGDGELKVRVQVCPYGIGVLPDGYGDKGTAEGYGEPVFLEFYDGELVLRAWADINQEDPTHTISLEGARESNREDEDDEG